MAVTIGKFTKAVTAARIQTEGSSSQGPHAGVPSISPYASSSVLLCHDSVRLFQWPFEHYYFSVKSCLWSSESLWGKLPGAGAQATRFQALLSLGTRGYRKWDFWIDKDTTDLSEGEPALYVMDFSFLRLLLRATEDEDGQKASEAAKQLAGRANRGRGKRPGE